MSWLTSHGSTTDPGTVEASSRTFSSNLSPWNVKASRAPSRAADWAMAQAMLRLLATPRINPCRSFRSMNMASGPMSAHRSGSSGGLDRFDLEVILFREPFVNSSQAFPRHRARHADLPDHGGQ